MEPEQPENPAAASDLSDANDVPLGVLADRYRAGDDTLDKTLHRIAPHDGSRILLVAASFNSAI